MDIVRNSESTSLTLSTTGSAVLLTRLAVRVRTVGIRQFSGDDYISMLVFLCYIGDAVSVDMTYHLGTNVDFTQERLLGMSESERQNVITGSKLELLAWYSYTALIWALKVCMLFFFGRLTSGLRMQTYVRYLGVVLLLSYVAVFLTITCGCFPIKRNWQIMPDPGLACTVSTTRSVKPEPLMLTLVQFKPQILYVSSTLNILTDGMILITPIPMLWNLEVRKSRKFGLSLLLFPGVFVIAAALIRVIMSLQVSPSALNINRWGVRETLAGVIAVNVPILRPILRISFWTSGPVLNEKKSSNTSRYDDRSHSQRSNWTSSRGRKFLGLDPERNGESKMPAKTVIEMSDRSSHYSNNSRGSAANSQEFIIPRLQVASPFQNGGKDGVLVETSFGSSVEYQNKDTKPEVPWGHPQDKANFVSSVIRAGE